MNFLKRHIFLLVFIGLTSCMKDEPPTSQPVDSESIDEESETPVVPEKVPYFTYHTHSSRDTSNSDDWLILHDEAGNLLDYGSYEVGDIMRFTILEADLPKNITVTFFSFQEDENYRTHYLISFSEVDTETEWYQSAAFQYEPPILTGSSYNLMLQNAPSLREYHIFSGPRTSDSKSAPSAFAAENLIKIGDLNPFSENRNILSTTDANEHLKYHRYENPGNLDSLVVDYEELLDYDQYLSIDLTTLGYSNLRIKGYFEDTYTGPWSDGDLLSDHTNYQVVPVAKGGYLNGYNIYGTEFTFSYPESLCRFAYFNYGDILTTIQIPLEPLLTIESDALKKPQFDIDFPYISKNAEWVYYGNSVDGKRISTSWRVNSSSDVYPTIGDLPEEMLNTYEFFKIEDLELNSILFDITAETYQESLERWFVTHEPQLIFNRAYFQFNLN